MTREIVWHIVADRDVLHMPWQIAARVCSDLLRFAETGAGELEQLEHGILRLRSRGGCALFRLDTKDGAVHVLRVGEPRSP